MIPREAARIILGILTITVTNTFAQDDKLYDTGDWIPVTPSASRPASLDQQKRQTEAGDRVLNLEAPQAQSFLPNDEYENRKKAQRPQNQQFLAETVYSKIPENAKPRRINFQPDNKFKNPVQHSNKQVDFYNEPLRQYWKVEQPPPFRGEKIYENANPYVPRYQVAPSGVQNYYTSNQQNVINQKPILSNTNDYLGVPNLNPQVPAIDALNIYDKYNIPFNRSFYESLNPSFINDEFYSVVNSTPQVSTTLRPLNENQDVQLVYVPVEKLKSNNNNNLGQNINLVQNTEESYENPVKTERNKQERLLYNPNSFSSNEQFRSQSVYSDLSSRPQVTQPLHSKVLPEEQRLAGVQQDYLQQTQQVSQLQQQFKNEIPPDTFSTTTPKSAKKRKPHQPPLAVYLSESQADISEVIGVLKNAKSIAVQDIVTPNSPRIFIGPSNLGSPNGYSKFPLPYLNNVNGKRVNLKIEQLPFFVAPLNYKTPQGYSKIPLPSPHVGSVVVSTTRESNVPTEQAFRQNHFNSPEVSYQNIKPSTRFNVGYQSTPSSYFTEQATNAVAENTAGPISYQNTRPVVSYESKNKNKGLSNINPLELAINDFELDQINKFQTIGKNENNQANSVPNTQINPSRMEQTTRAPGRSRIKSEYEIKGTTEKPFRRRGRPRQNIRLSTTTTTTPEPETDRYTILEEFDVRKANNQPLKEDQNIFSGTQEQITTPSLFQKYSNIENINEYVQTEKAKITPSYNEAPTKAFSQYLLENTNDYRKPLETTTSPLYGSADFETNSQGAQFETSDGIRYSIPNFETKTDTPQNIISNQFTYSTTDNANNKYNNKEISSLSNQQTQSTKYLNNNQVSGSPYQVQAEEYTLPPRTLSEEQFESQNQREQYEQPTSFKEIEKVEDINDMYISPLQDSAIRSLLQPNLLAPSGKQTTVADLETLSTIKLEPSTTTEPSTTLRARGRPRGRQPTTTTSVPRRVASRRRQPRPTTEKVNVESYSKEEYEPVKTSRQRFRTRGRPAQITASERSSTTEREVKSFEEQDIPTESKFNERPQSFVEFDAQFLDAPVTIPSYASEEGIREYHQIPISSTERELKLTHENTSPLQSEVPDIDIQKNVPIQTTNENENFIRYQTTLQPTIKPREESTTRRPTIRTRTRGRSRFTTTTSRSIPRSSTYHTPTTAENKEESKIQFVGEIRPKYNARKPTTTTVEVETEAPRPKIRSRIRVPGRTRTTTKTSNGEINDPNGTEQITRRSSVVRTRNRGASHYRPQQNSKRESAEDADIAGQNYPQDFLQKLESASKSKETGTDFEYNDDQALHASINRPKILPVPEGLTRIPESNLLPTEDKPTKLNLKQNYDTFYKSENAEFQTESATISDVSEEIFRQLTGAEETVLANLEKTENLPNDNYESHSTDEFSLNTFTTLQPTTVSYNSEKPKGRRRGVWKVIRHKVVDPLETAESQNYESVINAYQTIQKTKPHKIVDFTETKLKVVENVSTNPTTTEANDNPELNKSSTPSSSNESIFDKIYEMFDVFKDDNPKVQTEEPAIVSTTTTINPTFPQEITEQDFEVTTAADLLEDNITTVNQLDYNEDQKSLEKHAEQTTTEKEVQTISLSKNFEVEPWEMKAVKTSTSTEISHETEICYKGKCIKAKNKKKPIY